MVPTTMKMDLSYCSDGVHPQSIFERLLVNFKNSQLVKYLYIIRLIKIWNRHQNIFPTMYHLRGSSFTFTVYPIPKKGGNNNSKVIGRLSKISLYRCCNLLQVLVNHFNFWNVTLSCFSSPYDHGLLIYTFGNLWTSVYQCDSEA